MFAESRRMWKGLPAADAASAPAREQKHVPAGAVAAHEA
jgi:hypothetical protein